MDSKFKIEHVYLIFTLIFGVLLVFLLPPFQSPDEDSHFKKSYLLSEGVLFPEDNGSEIGNYIPDNLIEYINGKKGYMGDRDTKYSFSQYILDNQTLKISENKVFNNYSTVQINALAYLVPAIGVLLAKIVSLIVGLPFTIPNLLYGARLLSLIVYSIIIFYSIRQSPKFKKSMFVLALMPMTLSLICGVTYDGLLVSLTFLLFSIALKYSCDNKLKEISNKDLWILATIVFVYINVKYLYIFNLLILLIIPFKKFKCSWKEAFRKYGIPVLCIVLLYIISNYKNFYIDFGKYDSGSSLFGEQIQFVIKNPFKFVYIMLAELFSNRFFYLTTFTNTLGLLDTPSIPFFTVYYLLLLLFVVLVDGSEYDAKYNWKYRLLGILVPIACISLCFLAMYIYWTPFFYGVGADKIAGVQGRYFIPALCLLPMFFVNKFKFGKIGGYSRNIVVYSCLIILMFTLVTVLLRYWI